MEIKEKIVRHKGIPILEGGKSLICIKCGIEKHRDQDARRRVYVYDGKITKNYKLCVQSIKNKKKNRVRRRSFIEVRVINHYKGTFYYEINFEIKMNDEGESITKFFNLKDKDKYEKFLAGLKDHEVKESK